uniref:Tryptophyllin-3 n=1 Tax=Ascaphus truei TaxID=8439 RepID=TY3_ASCTR|nr:RecName: Full=Tryptophyllin-3 [Ascaphus truei]
DPWDWV